MVEKLNWDAAYLLIGILLTNANGATEVSCVFMERCILPCSFQTGNEITIKWFKTAGDKLVHLFNYNKDQLKLQDQCFRNRTLLFMDMISSGNASLQLTGVEIQDEGIYNCITHTTRENQESFVNLNIIAPVNNVNIDEIEDRITCWSEGIYPEPQLTWSTSPTPNITFLSTTTVQQTKQLLYNISSSLMFSDDLCNLLFICTVSTGRTRKTATLRKISLISDPSTDVTIPCTPSNTSLTNFTLLWRFNHNHTIVKQTGTNLTYSVSGEWRQKVVKVFKSGSLMIKDLSAKQEGMYTCKLSNAEVTHTSHIHLRLIKGGHSSTVVIITTVCVSVLIGLLIAALIYIICRIYRKQRGDGVI